MAYAIKEIFYTLQGEGAQTGRPAVFLRFSGCNLWSGREEDRASAQCNFCDTDFLGTDGRGGGRFDTPEELAAAARGLWPADAGPSILAPRPSPLAPSPAPFVVCTGGEPLLQLDAPLVAALHAQGFEIACETNGTLLPPPGLDWICVSPKAGTGVVLRSGSELKLIYPQPELAPSEFESWDFEHFFLQPMDGAALRENTQLAVEFCLRNPRWRLSLQTHKILGLP